MALETAVAYSQNNSRCSQSLQNKKDIKLCLLKDVVLKGGVETVADLTILNIYLK